MAEVPESISYIKLGENEHPIDAVTIDGKSPSVFQESGKIVTSIDSNSTDEEIPSAKSLYEMIWGRPTPEHDYSKDYLTFEALEDGTFRFSRNALRYSLDDGESWSTLSAGTNTPTVKSGNKILWKQTGLTPTSFGIGFFTSTGNFNVSGNIMSLLYGDDFENEIDLSGKTYVFFELFYNCNKLINSSNLILPATTLVNNCYDKMFRDCISLTTAPELPATTLASYCYSGMFYDCRSLTTAPTLPATTLAAYCYDCMFTGCRSLTTSPTLPATTLAAYCYSNMFSGCTHLTTAPSLPATTLASYCYNNMFTSTGLTTAPSLPATTLASYCYNYMFSGCTHLTTAPSLPATTLVDGCYNSMFSDCTSLTTVPTLPATTLASYCYSGMFYDCRSLTTAPTLPATTLAQNCYTSMFYGCIYLNSVTCYATTNITVDNLNNWLYNVSLTGTFIGDSNTIWSMPRGSSSIPVNWYTNVNIHIIESNHSLGMYVDDFLNIDYPLNNVEGIGDELGANEYVYTGNSINYNNQTYYIWERTDDSYDIVKYALTTTADYNTLYRKSLTYDLKNIVEHPVYYFFDDSMDEYSTCENQNIVNVYTNNNNTYIVVDDFLKDDVDVQDFIDDPASMGANYYEYCEPFEYNGDTYYIWIQTEDTAHQLMSNNVKYLLTETNDLQTLQSYSLESNINNLATFPIIYLNSDLREYDGSLNNNIISVFVLGNGIYSAGTLGMYVDDFPDYAWEDNGNRDMDEYLQIYMQHPEQGGNYYEYCDEFEYDGDTYYIWILTNDGRNGVEEGNNDHLKYLLTDTNDYQTLYNESLESTLQNIEPIQSSLICYLDRDLNELYDIGHRNRERIVKVFEL